MGSTKSQISLGFVDQDDVFKQLVRLVLKHFWVLHFQDKAIGPHRVIKLFEQRGSPVFEFGLVEDVYCPFRQQSQHVNLPGSSRTMMIF